MILCIQNASVLTPGADGFEKRTVTVADDRIVENGPAPDRVIDAAGLYLIPGLIDIHNHGSFGTFYPDPEADYSENRRRLASRGVTAVLPTASATPMERLLASIHNMTRQIGRMKGGAAMPGLHLEGPFISPNRTGAMVYPDIPCTVENFDRLYDAAGGLLRVMTLAPDRENAPEVAAHGAAKGVRMSAGHTAASYAQTEAAIDAGVTGATHTFNAMLGFEHREPGALGAVLTDDRVSCELIADFVHSHPASVKMAYRMKGAEKLILVSDNGVLTGMPVGEYDIKGYGKRVIHPDRITTVDGRLSCSRLTLDEDARHLLSLGVPLHEVCRMTSYNPAHAAGLDRDYGSVEPGRFADLILCGEELTIRRIFVGGEEIEPEEYHER